MAGVANGILDNSISGGANSAVGKPEALSRLKLNMEEKITVVQSAIEHCSCCSSMITAYRGDEGTR